MNKQQIENMEARLLNGQLTVSEISDEHVRDLLRRIISRHRGTLINVEQNLRADRGSIRPVEIVTKNSDPDLIKNTP